jgi:hypothetical protein
MGRYPEYFLVGHHILVFIIALYADNYSNENDQLTLGQKYQNHARVFVAKFHHSMHDDRYTQFKNTCPPNSVSDFRTDDYYFWSAQNLQHVDTIPCK